jgi:PAS domain S-box-containing protein
MRIKKTRPIIFYAVALLLPLWVYAQNPANIGLTLLEKEWLVKHPVISVAPDPDFPPIEWFDNNGKFTGIAADYVSLVQKQLGITFKIVRCGSWDEVLVKARNKEVDMLSAAAQTPQRAEYLLFTTPHVVMPGIIITRKEVRDNLTLRQLSGMKVALVSGYVWQEFISRDHPTIKLDPVHDVQTGLRKVSFGMDDAMIENLATATTCIEKEGIANLKVAGETGYYTRLSFAIRNDWPDLRSVLDKALASIDEKTKKAVFQRWIHIERQPLFPSRLFWIVFGTVMGTVVFIIIIILIWNRLLTRQVGERTSELSKTIGDLQTEISERKRAEDALRASERSYREIYNATNEAIFIHDACTGVILDVNQTMCEMFGYTQEESSHLTIGDLSSDEPPFSDVSAREWVTRAFKEGPQLFEWRAKRKNGELFWDETNLKRATIGGKDCILAVVRDISERKRGEMALSESERRYRFLFDCSPAGSVIIGPDGFLVDINKSFEQSLGYAREEIIKRRAIDFIADHDKERVLGVLRKRFGGEKVSEEIDTPVLAKDGSVHFINFAGGQAHLYNGEKFIGVLITGVDVTERRKAEELARQQQQKLIQADKMATLGVLVSGVAHEINNPNNFIILNSDNLRDIWKDLKPILQEYREINGDFMLAGLHYDEVREEVQPLIAGISEGAKRIRNIVQNLKDFARQEPGDTNQMVQINAVVDAATLILGNLIKKSTDRYSSISGEGIPPVKGAFQKIEQVVINLISNACQALTAKNQAVSVTTAFTRERGRVIVTVKDEGAGISPENLKHIMNPFFTTKRDSGGTGLGLAITYNIVKEHGGELTIESVPGKGTIATVSLPAAEEEKYHDGKCSIS